MSRRELIQIPRIERDSQSPHAADRLSPASCWRSCLVGTYSLPDKPAGRTRKTTFCPLPPLRLPSSSRCKAGRNRSDVRYRRRSVLKSCFSVSSKFKCYPASAEYAGLTEQSSGIDSVSQTLQMFAEPTSRNCFNFFVCIAYRLAIHMLTHSHFSICARGKGV